MKTYVKQLVDDIRAAKLNKRPPKLELPPELEFVRGAEEYLHGEAFRMSVLFDLAPISFPPPERLTENQLEEINEAMIDLWDAFNFIPEFPDDLSPDLIYSSLVSKLDYECVYVTQGKTHVEFCDYNPDACPFPESTCSCADF